MHGTDYLAPSEGAIRSRCRLPGGSFTEFPRADTEGSIGDRFAAQVRRFPDRLAIRTRDADITYAELGRAAARIADALRRPDAAGPVALVLETADAFIVASLGAALAGAIQVPMDGAFPLPRLTYMLEQSGARTILASERHVGFAREIGGPGRAVLVVESLAAHTGDGGPRAGDPGAARRPGPDTIAAIEYTSGSTGHPKGIVRSHRGVLHDVLRHTNMSRLCPEDRVMLPGRGAVHALHALLNGAAFLPAERHQDAIAGLADWLAAERVTVLRSRGVLLPGLRGIAHRLGAFPAPPADRALRRAGVRARRRSLPQALLDGLPARQHTRHQRVRRLRASLRGPPAARCPAASSPVATPRQDVEVLLLDEDGRPTGEDAGEIAIRSRYGAVGYWQMPELTGPRFRPGGGGGRRVYRTGDVGRIDPTAACTTSAGATCR